MDRAQGNTVEALLEIACANPHDLRLQLEQLLQYGLARFGMEVATLAQIQGQDYRIVQQLSPAQLDWQDGASHALGDTYCALTLDAAQPQAVHDVARSATPHHPARHRFGLRAYLGIPLRVDGELYGTLSFAHRQASRREFGVEDFTDLQRMATWLEAELVRRERECELQRQEERFRRGFYAAPSAMLILNHRGEIEQANSEAERLFHYREAELLGQPVEILVPETSRPGHPRLRDGFLRSPEVLHIGGGRDLLAQNARGEVFPVEVGLNPFHSRGEDLVLCAVIDLTERKHNEQIILEQAQQLEQANRQLSQRAITDPLTHVYNRHHFMVKLKEYLSLAHRSGECVSILMLDVDHFKKYNDSYGHTAGDEALKAVAGELTRQTRDVDIVARYGGEEFIILLPATDREGALVSAERIRSAVEGIGHLRRVVTLSIGIATAMDIANPTQAIEAKCRLLIDKADQALYRSKQLGRNRITHCEALRATD